MWIPVESSFFRCWSPVLKPQDRANRGPVSKGRDTDWEALWRRMPRVKRWESWVVNLVTGWLNAWDGDFLLLLCCYASQPFCPTSFGCDVLAEMIPLCAHCLRGDQGFTCSCALQTAQTAHRPAKKAGAALSWHMRHCGLIVLVEMAKGIGTGDMLLIKTVHNWRMICEWE